MTRFLSGTALCLALAVLGCGRAEPRKPRPVAGDTVRTEVVLGKPWKQNGYVLLSSHLRVADVKGIDGGLLQLEDIPHPDVPKATLTFFEEGKVLETWDEVALTRDC